MPVECVEQAQSTPEACTGLNAPVFLIRERVDLYVLRRCAKRKGPCDRQVLSKHQTCQRFARGQWSLVLGLSGLQ